jgi:hypothetical protein
LRLFFDGPFGGETMKNEEKEEILQRLLALKSTEEILRLTGNLDDEDKAWLLNELFRTAGFERSPDTNHKQGMVK